MENYGLVKLLEDTAKKHPSKGITIYQPGQPQGPSISISYVELLRLGRQNAADHPCLQQHKGGSIVLLHFNSHQDYIIWFWSVLIAGGIPAISPPLSHDLDQRKKHLNHLNHTLYSPALLTSKALVDEISIAGSGLVNIYTIDGDNSTAIPTSDKPPQTSLPAGYESLASLMLTSGSTGNSKAVPLTHQQIIAAVSGKSQHHGTVSNDIFLNWIGMDHVANLTEIHLHALYVGAEQVHVHASDVVSDPLSFLHLLSKHRVAYTFAPNFFLAALLKKLKSSPSTEEYDLSALRYLISGGEANNVQTIQDLTATLQVYSANDTFIRPGFGMTETCAGSIYSRDSRVDGLQGREFAALGHCIPGIRMRVASDRDSSLVAEDGEVGDLEVSGPVVFNGYFNNNQATDSAIRNGWFRTGDRAMIDDNGCLNLCGRTKDTMNINGVKYHPHEVESAIENEGIAGVLASFVVVFSHRKSGDATESVCVIYAPTYRREDRVARGVTADAIARSVFLHTNSRPMLILPLPKSLLQKTSLGKLPKAKIKAAYTSGRYDEIQNFNDEELAQYKGSDYQEPQGYTETIIAEQVASLFNMPREGIDAHTSLLDLGMSSIEIIQLRRNIGRAFSYEGEIPMMAIMQEPSIRGIAATLNALVEGKRSYQPIVTLNATGSKTPLWLIHPGVGEVLVFLPLAKYITDRPLYALRARGFEAGEEPFECLEETVATYLKAIKSRQPQGPYAIAGYSYGSMLAFELAKALGQRGDSVPFLGSFNLPPHIKMRMRQLDHVEVALSLAFFLRLISEEYAQQLSPLLHQQAAGTADGTADGALEHILEICDKKRLAEVDMNLSKLRKWTGLAYGLQAMARDYEPAGLVEAIDVFHADPLKAVSPDRQHWLDQHLNRWSDFSRQPPRLHHAQGSHYTMLAPEHVFSFQRTLAETLRDRGL